MKLPADTQKVFNPDSGAHRRDGLNYKLTDEEIVQFREQGYLVLDEFMTEAEVSTLDHWFDHFITGKQEGMGRDFCDMSQPYGTPVEEFRLVNAVLPTHYCNELENNIYHQIASNVASQLYQEDKTVMDYDQFLAKKPGKEQAQFLMHQDLGYWPKTKNTWTATFSLALTDSDVENGCLVVLPGTNKESELRAHRPVSYGGSDDLAQNRDESHTLMIESRDTDKPIYLPVKRGSVTIHDERIVHGSGGNTSDIWRKTYVMAFRPEETVNEERAMGFTHSHNDDVKWETFIS
ncbi:MAG: phytanoyl-CoA dioxygenase family protein [Mariniblastus sp.]|nr:phytanoyl-CoA dioxygenase family protein [Mariniblastus sp.]